MLISKNKQRGFSMIEVLVSLLVIGVGLLGLSGLQIATLKGTNNAHSRNVASLLAMDLSDRMRSNRNGVTGDFYDNDVECATAEAVQCNSETDYCTSQQTARFDVQEVMCGVSYGDVREGGVANSLFSGALTIQNMASITANTKCADISDPNLHKIIITWSNKKLDDDQRDADVNQTLEICVIP